MEGGSQTSPTAPRTGLGSGVTVMRVFGLSKLIHEAGLGTLGLK
jgi:hypothetical protein